MLSAGDKAEFRQMLTDVLATHTAIVDGKFNLIDEKLDRIETQTVKTNGRVNKHDEELRALENSDLSRKTVISFTTRAIAITATITAVVVAIVELIIK